VISINSHDTQICVILRNFAYNRVKMRQIA
jgi:hypothetical protein